eukprot:symbB.v1.2.014894.t1/scaffold1101.1/size137853/4
MSKLLRKTPFRKGLPISALFDDQVYSLDEVKQTLAPRLPRIRQSPVVVTNALKDLSAAERPDLVHQILEVMMSEDVSVDLFQGNIAITAYARMTRWQKGLDVFSSLPQMRLSADVISYNATINGLKASEWEKALHLFATMPAAQVHPNTVTFNTTIAACGAHGRWELALGLLNDMPRANASPTVISYCAALSACEKGTQWKQAFNLFEDVFHKSLAKDAVAYNATISACEKGEQWEMSLEILERMLAASVRPDVYTFCGAIASCGR